MPSNPRSDDSARFVRAAQPVIVKPSHSPPSTTAAYTAWPRRESQRRAAHASREAPAISCSVPVDGARCWYLTLTRTQPIRKSSAARRSIGRAPGDRDDRAIDTPTLTRKSGNTSSASR
jgi:hypothetical protein